jgi:hypothetical protein
MRGTQFLVVKVFASDCCDGLITNGEPHLRKDALDIEGIDLSVWRIHRRIGMSGGLFTNMLLRETGLDISPERVERLLQLHANAWRQPIGLESRLSTRS